MKMVRLYLHPPLERLWHGLHTLLILALIASGIFLRWPELGVFKNYFVPVHIHNICGILLVADYAFWIFYLLFSGRFSHYVPRQRDLLSGLVAQAFFYGLGIFKGEPHPFHASEDEKFNPLQKYAYIAIMFALVPLLCVSGVILMFPGLFAPLLAKIGGLAVLSRVHAGLAFGAAAFLVSHVYMASMGSTVLDAFVSMVTGWVNEPAHDEGHGEDAPEKPEAPAEA